MEGNPAPHCSHRQMFDNRVLIARRYHLLINVGALLLVPLAAAAAATDEKPVFLNPQMLHVAVERADPNGYLSICPNVCELPIGRLLIAYHRTTQVDFSGQYSTWTRQSNDGGKSWTEARLLDKHLQAPGLLALPSGELLLNGCTVIDE